MSYLNSTILSSSIGLVSTEASLLNTLLLAIPATAPNRNGMILDFDYSNIGVLPMLIED